MNTVPPARLQVTTVTTDDEFDSLADAWNNVVRRSDRDSVFLRHEWFRAAWAWRRLDADLRVFVARNSLGVVGILPLVIAKDRNRRGRHAELLTVPDTQLCDLIVTRDAAAESCDAFAATLASSKEWDTLHLDFLETDSSGIRFLLPALRRHGARFDVQDRSSNWFVGLDGAWNEYYGARSRSVKKAVNLAANRLKKAGEIRIEWLSATAGDLRTFDRLIAATIGISARSWKQDTGNSLDRPGPQAFIRALSNAARDNAWLSLWLLYAGDKAMAMEYQLIYGGKVHALRADFDAAHDELSPGTHLFRHLLERLFERGLSRYYMGPGDNAYKRRWTETGEPLKRAYVYNRNWRGMLAWSSDSVLKPIARKIRDRLSRLRGRSRSEPDTGPSRS